MKKTKVAVIGIGHLGYFHARTYKQLESVELVGVCDIIPDRAKTVAAELGCEFFTDCRALFPRVEAVSIAVPTQYHYKIAREFLEHRIHTLVEKPITRTVQEAKRLLAIARKNKCVLQVGHIERFNSAFRAVKSLIAAPKFIECHRLGPFTPRVRDVGVVLDLMIHDIDIVLGLVKSDVKNIEAVGAKILTRHEDIANARLTFKNNTVCNLTASRLAPENMRKIRVFVNNAYISLDYVRQTADIHRKIRDKIVSEKLNIPREDALKEELSSFIQCVGQKKQPVVSGQDALNALKIALTIVKKINP